MCHVCAEDVTWKPLMMIGPEIFQFFHKMKELYGHFKGVGVIQKFGQILSLQQHHFLGLDPSIEMAINPTFFEEIEKSQCPSSSMPKGLQCDIFRTHVAHVHVPKNICLEDCEH